MGCTIGLEVAKTKSNRSFAKTQTNTKDYKKYVRFIVPEGEA